MTEADWLFCTDPALMLEVLRGKDSDRKLRLFGVACCRYLWPEEDDEIFNRAMESAEEYADKVIPESALKRTRRTLVGAQRGVTDVESTMPWAAYALAEAVISEKCYADVFRQLRYLSFIGLLLPSDDERSAFCHRVRDIVGNPFRSTFPEPGWLTSNVLDLARTIYDERAFDRLPILADALMDAGCSDDAILSHCRAEGAHVRGCWVVDLLLGKA